MLGHGQAGLFDRFSASGKENLILLIITDLDPGGDNIAQNCLNYMIRDAGIDEERVEAWKVALTLEQARSLGLPENPTETVKPEDGAGPAYIAKYGTDCVGSWTP